MLRARLTAASVKLRSHIESQLQTDQRPFTFDAS